MSYILVAQKRSSIGQSKRTRRVVESLGLKGPGTERVHKDNNCIRGMINVVHHLVAYKFVEKPEIEKVSTRKPKQKVSKK